MKDYSKPYITPYYDELKRVGMKLPAFLTHIRTDLARIEKPKDARMFRMMFLTPRVDGCCGTLDTSPMSNLLMIITENNSNMRYNPNPSKEDLLEYFGKSGRVRVRKMHEIEAMRLMDVDEADIMKLYNATKTVRLKSGKRITRRVISKTAMYKLAGNSIVVSCLFHIFRTLFMPGQPENGFEEKKSGLRQMSIFDMLQEPDISDG